MVEELKRIPELSQNLFNLIHDNDIKIRPSVLTQSAEDERCYEFNFEVFINIKSFHPPCACSNQSEREKQILKNSEKKIKEWKFLLNKMTNLNGTLELSHLKDEKIIDSFINNKFYDELETK